MTSICISPIRAALDRGFHSLERPRHRWLLAYQIVEKRHSNSGVLPTHLTADMYRAPDFSPVKIVTRTVRDGYRIKVIDAEFFSSGVSVGRARQKTTPQKQQRMRQLQA